MEDPSGPAAVAEAPSAPAVSAPAPSSPASPTPTPQPSVPERPTSFAEAFARVGDSQPPKPGDPPEPGAQPVAATAPPPPEQPPVVPAPVADPKKGPIPFENHQRILTNARAKTEAEVTQRFQQQYGPFVELGRKIQSDPVGTVTQLVTELANHPDHGSAVISALARTLGSRRQTAQTVPDGEPGPDLQTPDGIRVYSAEQQAKREAWFRSTIEQSITEQLSPLQAREQAAQVQERHAAATHDAHNRMSQALKPYQALPEFTEHKAAIGAKVASLLEEGYPAETALGLAVVAVLREVVLPGRAAQSQATLMAEAVRKSTGANSSPGVSPAAPASRPTSFHEAFSRIPL